MQSGEWGKRLGQAIGASIQQGGLRQLLLYQLAESTLAGQQPPQTFAVENRRAEDSRGPAETA
jgi:hypothetical protein